MSAKTYSILAAVLFAIVAALQLARALGNVEVVVGSHEVPVLASWIASGVLGLLAILGFTARRG